MRHSISLRLVLTAGSILAVFAVLFFFAMIAAYRGSLEQSLHKRLAADARLVVATAQWLDDRLVISDRLEDVRFDNVESDFIALVYDRSGQLLWRSASSRDYFPAYQPEAEALEGRFIRFDTGKDRPDYYLFDLEFMLGEQVLSVITGDDALDIDASVKTYRQQLGLWLAASIGALLLVVTGALLWAIMPLRRFRQQMREIEKGSMAQLDGNYPAEIQPLARGLNRLLRAERARQECFQANVADLAHGLKTPLAVIADTADTLHGEAAQVLVKQVQHMNQLITYHLQRARAVQSDWALPALALAPVLERLCSSLDKIYRDKAVQWVVQVGDISLHLAEGQVLEIFGNLAENAFRLCVSKVVIAGAFEVDNVRISVADDGPGLSEEKARKLLQRGGRADRRFQSQGIGLSVVMDILAEAGGSLTAERADLGGAEFVVRLPLAVLRDRGSHAGRSE